MIYVFRQNSSRILLSAKCSRLCDLLIRSFRYVATPSLKYYRPHNFTTFSLTVSNKQTQEEEVAVPQQSETPERAGNGATSSQKVSPESSLSPVLSEYKEYLLSCYKARALAPADKYLSTLEAPYINLAIIRRGLLYNPEQRNEISRRMLYGGVDEILESQNPIHIENLLTPEHSGRPVRFILIEGPPGIGKSTFVWEACRRWDEIESLSDYHTVVLLKLKEKWVLGAVSLSDLFRCPFQPELSKNIVLELHNGQEKNLLMVLDGFDEISLSFNDNSVIKSILCRQLLPECTIVVTTRSSAKHTLRSVCQPQIDKHIEIVGFTEEERVRYITEVFSEEPGLEVNFLKYMFLVPHVKSMMYIPLNCAIIAQVYYESQSSRHLAIPRTRTQLYRALTHSIVVRHMKMKEDDREFTSTLPESLNDHEMKKFKAFAKFAFDTYHEGNSDLFYETSETRKGTFFKEDIPEGLVHFGFMNESTEMYAGKGVERAFSFVHLSLQEYLATWHLTNTYSIEFQVAYHKLAVDGDLMYRGKSRDEKALISSLWQQRSSLVEPAIFLAGITGWKDQSEDDKKNWELYLSHDTANIKDPSVLLRSLYEAQNPAILSHYFLAETRSGCRKDVSIGHHSSSSQSIRAPYDCYALSYCLAHSSDVFNLSLGIRRDNDISLVETFVKGLEDHCKYARPRVRELNVELQIESQQISTTVVSWLLKANCWTELETMKFECRSTIGSDVAQHLLQNLGKLKFIYISIGSWEWLPALKSLGNHELKGFHITNKKSCPTRQKYAPYFYRQAVPNWTQAVLDVEFPSTTMRYEVSYSLHLGINSLFKSVQRSNEFTEMKLHDISRETMAGVYSLLLRCSSLATLEIKRGKLGYDGILHICSALIKNTALRHLVIHDDLHLPPKRGRRKYGNIDFTSLSSARHIPLPSKTSCTDFLLQLNTILKHNTTLKEVKIQTGLFLPLSAGRHCEYCQWTGLGPLQQFNVGAVASGMSPNLRRSFSSSDLTQPQSLLFWDRRFGYYFDVPEVNFTELFSRRKTKGKKLLSIPSFSASDTKVFQSFSGLDSRVKDCLEISNLSDYVEELRWTCWGVLREVSMSMEDMNNISATGK